MTMLCRHFRRDKQVSLAGVVTLIAAALWLLVADGVLAAGEQTYAGNMGNASAAFVLIWEDSGDVLGRCELQSGGTVQLVGSNYAEGKLRLGVFNAGKQIGLLELSKTASAGVVSWVGQASFSDGARFPVRFSRSREIPASSAGVSVVDIVGAAHDTPIASNGKQPAGPSLGTIDFEKAFSAGAPVTQDDELVPASVGAYEGQVSGAAAKCELYWNKDKTVTGQFRIQAESNSGRVRVYELVGHNQRDGEVSLRVFSEGHAVGQMELHKNTQANSVSWEGQFAGTDGRTAPVKFGRLPNSEDMGRIHAFGGDLAKLKCYLMWSGEADVYTEGLMGPLGNVSLKRVGDSKFPNIEIAEELPADITTGLLLMDKKLVVLGHGKTITALDAETGGKLWSVQFPFDIGGVEASTDRKTLFVTGATGGEVLGIESLWTLTVDANSAASELLRAWSPGSEGGLPASAQIAMRIPGTDKFIVEVKDNQNADGMASRTEASQRSLFVFDATDCSLRRANKPMDALVCLLSSGERKRLDPTSEDGTLTTERTTLGGAETTYSLVKKPRLLELVSELGGKGVVIRSWKRSPLSTSRLAWDESPLWFTNGQLVGSDKGGKPSVLADLQEPGAFLYRAKVSKSATARPTKKQNIENERYKIFSFGDYFGLSVEITDKNRQTNSSVSARLPEGVQAVGYGENVQAEWIDKSRAILGLPTGQFLLANCSEQQPLALLMSGGLAPSTGLFSQGQSGTVLSLSGQRLYRCKLDADAKTLKPEFFITCDESGPNAVVYPDNIYAGFREAMKAISAVAHNRALPFEQFDLRLNRPDIVLERLSAPAEAVRIAKQLREKRLKRMGVTEEMLKPDFHLPELEIVGDVPATTNNNQIEVAIKGLDSKYPLERLKVFVNNVPVNGRDGESLREQNTQSLERTIPIKLAAGRNKIQVSVLNNAGAESLYANAEVNCTAHRPRPTLYAVALGVSEYANPEWNLKYAAKDAKDVMDRLKAKAGGNYGEVKELLLTDKDVTKESLAKVVEFLKGATIDDTVLMFAAGHGLLDSKYDYYFGTTDIDFNNPAEKGIAFEDFDDILADLPCLKKSLLVDTCHAGELDQDEKTLLASAGTGGSASLPTGQGVAVRSIGTRGMNVKAVEGARGASEWYDRLQGLFVDLRRGSGSTILSSSAGAEYALESSEQQNGLFTYAVLEALDGKEGADANKDGSVQMSELGEYVKKRVADLTNNKQTPNTRRVNLEGDFVVAKTR